MVSTSDISEFVRKLDVNLRSDIESMRRDIARYSAESAQAQRARLRSSRMDMVADALEEVQETLRARKDYETADILRDLVYRLRKP